MHCQGFPLSLDRLLHVEKEMAACLPRSRMSASECARDGRGAKDEFAAVDEDVDGRVGDSAAGGVLADLFV